MASVQAVSFGGAEKKNNKMSMTKKGALIGTGWGAINYAVKFSNPQYRQAFKNTLNTTWKASPAGTVIGVVLGTALGFGINAAIGAGIGKIADIIIGNKGKKAQADEKQFDKQA